MRTQLAPSLLFCIAVTVALSCGAVLLRTGGMLADTQSTTGNFSSSMGGIPCMPGRSCSSTSSSSSAPKSSSPGFPNFPFFSSPHGAAGGTSSSASSSSSHISSSSSEKSEEDQEKEEDQEHEDTQENEDRQESSSSVSSVRTEEQNDEEDTVLGCFDLLGKWTTERSLCDPNQMKYLFPPSSQASSQTSINILPVQPVPPVETQTSSISDAQRMEEEAAIRRMIEERLISEAERQQVRQRLLANVADAIARLTQLMEQQSLPAEIAEKVTGTVTWLQQVALSALPGTASLGDMQIQAEALRGRLTETQAMISTALRERGVATTYNPLTLTEKFDRFFAAIPPAITLLQAEGAVVPATAITSFNEAKQIFEQLKPGCIQDSSTCGKLAAVIPPLEQCTDALKASIASTGRDDLEQKIDLLLQK